MEKTAYAMGDVVAAAPAVGGRACGVGQSAFASYMPKWLVVSTLLLCVTAAGALQASGGFQPGGAYPPAGFHTWVMQLGRTRERFVLDGTTHYPNPPFDDAPPTQLDALADFFTVALEPDALAAYQQGFLAALRPRDSPGAVPGAGDTAAGGETRDLRMVHAELGHQRPRDVLAALRLRDSPQDVPDAGGTAAEDALRTVVPPSGGEIYELATENDFNNNDEGDATAYAETEIEDYEI